MSNSSLPGYNFPSLEAIRPYLEPAGEGPTAKWAKETAKRLKCKVCVGYPEIENASSLTLELTAPSDNKSQGAGPESKKSEEEKYYNSLLVVDENGEVLLNYRKAFLYYTDETWAAEGSPERGFCTLSFDSSSLNESGILSEATSNNSSVYLPKEEEKKRKKKQVATSFGICMDINPYRFEAPFTAWEFANRVLDSKSELVIVSMAWLSLLSREELDNLADKPEMDTFKYWIRRFWPLLEKKMNHDTNVDVSDEGEDEKKVIIVFANRAGEEKGGTEDKPTARYAGTSAIVAVTQRPCRQPSPSTRLGKIGDTETENEAAGETQEPFDVKILCWDLMGATEEGVCFADTTAEPKMVFGLVGRG